MEIKTYRGIPYTYHPEEDLPWHIHYGKKVISTDTEEHVKVIIDKFLELLTENFIDAFNDEIIGGEKE